MNTEQLIRALAADRPGRLPSIRAGFAAALAAGLAIAAVLFWLMLGPRSDIAAAAAMLPFIFKFVVTLVLAVAAAGLVLRLARPGAAGGAWLLALLLGPALLGIGIMLELFSVPPSAWWPRLVGTNSYLCLTSIPLLATPILAALFVALRQGAATRPGLAGAVAGTLAGSLGAALYAAHCVDDSPLFVATWYGLAIALVAVVGALLGTRLLRW
jgi:hypothetical protein